MSKFLVSTGYTSWRTTEIIDLSNEEVTCQDLENYPLDIAEGVGLNIGSFPVICGGFDGSGSINQCYQLDEGEWKEFATMNSRRAGAAGILHGNSFMVFGGFDNDLSVRLQSTEIINENGQVSQGSNMPIAVAWHAITDVNSTTSIISGGDLHTNSFSTLTWYYNHVTQEFQLGPSLMEGRQRHGSGTVFDQKTKEKIVVVAGGWDGVNDLDSTELLIDGEWQQGENLPS